MARQIAITKRIDLSDLDDGWDGCYAVVTKATYDEYAEISEFDPSDPKADKKATFFSIELAKKHFIKGEIMVINDAGEPEKVPMEADDIDASRDLADRLMGVVTGVAPDPKDSSIAKVESSTNGQPTSTSSTKTQ